MFGPDRLTYGELDDRSNRLAQHLRSIGVRPGDIVAIHTERSMGLVVAMLGVLKAGAAYLPLDPAYPVERLAFMMRDLDVDTLITGADAPAALSAIASRQVDLRAEGDAWKAGPTDGVQNEVLPTDLAYVMFTSGSTGQPKGVGIPHQAVTRLVRATNYIQLGPGDCVAQASNASFDASTFEIWGALLNGGRLVGLDRATILSPSGLSDAILEHGVTVIFLTTALFHQLASAAPGMFAALRYLVVGGEVLDPNAARTVLAAGPPQHFLNAYGPTENTTFSTTHELVCPLDDDATVPIGRSIASSTCYVLDPKGALLPAGAAGELYVGGEGLAVRYLRRPELTDARFVAHPFVEGQRLYRTGDRACWRWDGRLQFLGRTDGQVKLRGHRIEPGEIEHALHLHADVRRCAVVARDDGQGDARLVAYWTATDGATVTADELRAHARRTLPDYMVPSAFVRMTSLPLTANGKLDVGALPRPGRPDESATIDSGRLLSVLEARLAQLLWCEVLELDHVGVDGHFFDLGGHSLAALRLAARIRNACGRHVSIASVFSHPTVARMATFLESPDEDGPRSIVQVRRGGSRPPLYFPPGVIGETQVHDAFIDAMPLDQPVYAFEDDVAHDALTPSIEAIAARLCGQLQAHQPEGPMALAGYSFGGILAYEMARQLSDSGRDVRLVVILDTGPDRPSGRTAKARLESLWLFLLNLPRWIRDDLLFPLEEGTPARLRRSLRKLWRSLVRARGNREERPEPRLEDIFDVSGWPPEKRAHAANSLRALASYRFGPYSGRIVVMRARTKPLFSDHSRDLGWSAVAPMVTIVDVPGNHHTMLMEPHVRTLASALGEAVRALDA